MERSGPDVISVRVIVREEKMNELKIFIRALEKIREFYRQRLFEKTHVTVKKADELVNKILRRDVCSSCGLMQGFIVCRAYFDEIIDVLKERLEVFAFYHEKTVEYERICFTSEDSSFALAHVFLEESINEPLVSSKEIGQDVPLLTRESMAKKRTSLLIPIGCREYGPVQLIE